MFKPQYQDFFNHDVAEAPSFFGVVYCATNTVNGKKYVGKTTKTLYERMCKHLDNSKGKPTIHFHRAINKYGIESFTWKTVDVSDIDENDLNRKESSWISALGTFGKGYNQTKGGDGVSGRIVSEEQRKKHAIGKLGKKWSDESKKKLSDAKKGIPLSKEHRNKMIARIPKGEASSLFKRLCEQDTVKLLEDVQKKTFTKKQIYIKYNIGEKILNRILSKACVVWAKRVDRSKSITDEKEKEILKDIKSALYTTEQLNKKYNIIGHGIRNILLKYHIRKQTPRRPDRPGWRRGIKLTEEHRLKLSEAHRRGNCNKGRGNPSYIPLPKETLDSIVELFKQKTKFTVMSKITGISVQKIKNELRFEGLR